MPFSNVDSMITNLVLCCLISLFSASHMTSQIGVHAHNDYMQSNPFYDAIDADVNTIEIDVLLINDSILVAHDETGLAQAQLISEQYFIPITEWLSVTQGDARHIQFMIDIKNTPDQLMTRLLQVIDELPEFKMLLQEKRIQPLLISGSKPQSYRGWPEYILFDHQRLDDLAEIPMERVGQFSFNFRKFSEWDGNGQLPDEEKRLIHAVIESVHALNKKIRFWATPDNPNGWRTLYNLGVDLINTDMPRECRDFLNSIQGMMGK